MWWLNKGPRQLQNASMNSFSAVGAGGNRIYIDPELDLVVVIRWLGREHFPHFLNLILSAIK